VRSSSHPSRTGSIRVLAAQGYLRGWDADGTVRPRSWDGAADVVRAVDATVLSEEDLADPRDVASWAAHGAILVTLAERGARVLARGTAVDIAGFHADRVVDPTGAGDAFAAGLAIALAEGKELAAAARFANAVASFAVEGIGQAGLADRARVDARLGSPAP
jgi:sugar/nucleoside kinase (ribokinase family)